MSVQIRSRRQCGAIRPTEKTVGKDYHRGKIAKIQACSAKANCKEIKQYQPQPLKGGDPTLQLVVIRAAGANHPRFHINF